jgi:hypothetical protein
MSYQLFARVELRGTPGEATYTALNAYMQSMHWYSVFIPSEVALPHATYQAVKVSAMPPDLAVIGQRLKSDIDRTIWERPLILVIRSADWVQIAD